MEAPPGGTAPDPGPDTGPDPGPAAPDGPPPTTGGQDAAADDAPPPPGVAGGAEAPEAVVPSPEPPVAAAGAHPPPSPLSGGYLLIIIGEPHSAEHRDLILQRIAKGFLSWDSSDCHVDLEKELSTLSSLAPKGEEARNGERLVQYASESLVTEVLVHPQVNTLLQCVRNLLSSFTRHRHILHAGYTFAGTGSWILQDGTFSYADLSELFHEPDVQRVLRAYENSVSVDVHCCAEGPWRDASTAQHPFTRYCRVRVNPPDVLTAGSPAINSFIDYASDFVNPAMLDSLMEPSDVVGNIRFSHPTLYVFPGGQGDAALFGINGFNMLVDGGFGRKSCFWDFARHLDRLDAVLLTRLNNANAHGLASLLRRKRNAHVYPQIGHFFCNLQDRKVLTSPDGDKDRDNLLVSLVDEGQEMVLNLRHLQLKPSPCYRDSAVEPVNLYHKVGHGKLDMYVVSPARDSKEVKEFLARWTANDAKLFASHLKKDSRDFQFPLQNMVSICALLVWQPANPQDTITRILFPGSTPQVKIFEGLDKLRHLDFLKHPTCTAKSLSPSPSIVGLSSKTQTKKYTPTVIDKITPGEQQKTYSRTIPTTETSKHHVLKTATIPIAGGVADTKVYRATTTTAASTVTTNKSHVITRKSEKVSKIEVDNQEKVEKSEKDIIGTENKLEDLQNNIGKEEKSKDGTKVRSKPRQASQSRERRSVKLHSAEKKEVDKKEKKEEKISPTTPKKILNGVSSRSESVSRVSNRSSSKTRRSPSATPAKSAKEANNRKVAESKVQTTRTASVTRSTVTRTIKREENAETTTKPKAVEKQPVTKRTKPMSPSKGAKTQGSPAKTQTKVVTSKVGSIRKSRANEKDDLAKKPSEKSSPSKGNVKTTGITESKASVKQIATENKETEGKAIEAKEDSATHDNMAREEIQEVHTIETVVDVTAESVCDEDEKKSDGEIQSLEGGEPEEEEEDEYLVIEKEEPYTEESFQDPVSAESHAPVGLEDRGLSDEDGEDEKLKRDTQESEKVKDFSEKSRKKSEPKLTMKITDKEHAEQIAKTSTEEITIAERKLSLHSPAVMSCETLSLGNKEKLVEEVQEIITSATEIISKKDASPVGQSEDKVGGEPESVEKVKDVDDEFKVAEGKHPSNEIKEESQPDEKMSTTAESGATTAPTLPEDERIPLDEIKEVVEEKHVLEETKEKDQAKADDGDPEANHAERPGHFEIRNANVSALHRDIIKTPDEVADLPVDEEYDPELYSKDGNSRGSLEELTPIRKESVDAIPVTGSAQKQSPASPDVIEVVKKENSEIEKIKEMREKLEQEDPDHGVPVDATAVEDESTLDKEGGEEGQALESKTSGSVQDHIIPTVSIECKEKTDDQEKDVDTKEELGNDSASITGLQSGEKGDICVSLEELRILGHKVEDLKPSEIKRDDAKYSEIEPADLVDADVLNETAGTKPKTITIASVPERRETTSETEIDAGPTEEAATAGALGISMVAIPEPLEAVQEDVYLESSVEEEPIYGKTDAPTHPEYVTVTPDSSPEGSKSPSGKRNSVVDESDRKSSITTQDITLPGSRKTSIETNDEERDEKSVFRKLSTEESRKSPTTQSVVECQEHSVDVHDIREGKRSDSRKPSIAAGDIVGVAGSESRKSSIAAVADFDAQKPDSRKDSIPTEDFVAKKATDSRKSSIAGEVTETIKSSTVKSTVEDSASALKGDSRKNSTVMDVSDDKNADSRKSSFATVYVTEVKIPDSRKSSVADVQDEKTTESRKTSIAVTDSSETVIAAGRKESMSAVDVAEGYKAESRKSSIAVDDILDSEKLDSRKSSIADNVIEVEKADSTKSSFATDVDSKCAKAEEVKETVDDAAEVGTVRKSSIAINDNAEAEKSQCRKSSISGEVNGTESAISEQNVSEALKDSCRKQSIAAEDVADVKTVESRKPSVVLDNTGETLKTASRKSSIAECGPEIKAPESRKSSIATEDSLQPQSRKESIASVEVAVDKIDESRKSSVVIDDVQESKVNSGKSSAADVQETKASNDRKESVVEDAKESAEGKSRKSSTVIENVLEVNVSHSRKSSISADDKKAESRKSSIVEEKVSTTETTNSLVSAANKPDSRKGSISTEKLPEKQNEASRKASTAMEYDPLPRPESRKSSTVAVAELEADDNRKSGIDVNNSPDSTETTTIKSNDAVEVDEKTASTVITHVVDVHKADSRKSSLITEMERGARNNNENIEEHKEQVATIKSDHSRKSSIQTADAIRETKPDDDSTERASETSEDKQVPAKDILQESSTKQEITESAETTASAIADVSIETTKTIIASASVETTTSTEVRSSDIVHQETSKKVHETETSFETKHDIDSQASTAKKDTVTCDLDVTTNKDSITIDQHSADDSSPVIESPASATIEHTSSAPLIEKTPSISPRHESSPLKAPTPSTQEATPSTTPALTSPPGSPVPPEKISPGSPVVSKEHALESYDKTSPQTSVPSGSPILKSPAQVTPEASPSASPLPESTTASPTPSKKSPAQTTPPTVSPVQNLSASASPAKTSPLASPPAFTSPSASPGLLSPPASPSALKISEGQETPVTTLSEVPVLPASANYRSPEKDMAPPTSPRQCPTEQKETENSILQEVSDSFKIDDSDTSITNAQQNQSSSNMSPATSLTTSPTRSTTQTYSPASASPDPNSSKQSLVEHSAFEISVVSQQTSLVHEMSAVKSTTVSKVDVTLDDTKQAVAYEEKESAESSKLKKEAEDTEKSEVTHLPLSEKHETDAKNMQVTAIKESSTLDMSTSDHEFEVETEHIRKHADLTIDVTAASLEEERRSGATTPSIFVTGCKDLARQSQPSESDTDMPDDDIMKRSDDVFETTSSEPASAAKVAMTTDSSASNSDVTTVFSDTSRTLAGVEVPHDKCGVPVVGTLNLTSVTDALDSSRAFIEAESQGHTDSNVVSQTLSHYQSSSELHKSEQVASTVIQAISVEKIEAATSPMTPLEPMAHPTAGKEAAREVFGVSMESNKTETEKSVQKDILSAERSSQSPLSSNETIKQTEISEQEVKFSEGYHGVGKALVGGPESEKQNVSDSIKSEDDGDEPEFTLVSKSVREEYVNVSDNDGDCKKLAATTTISTFTAKDVSDSPKHGEITKTVTTVTKMTKGDDGEDAMETTTTEKVQSDGKVTVTTKTESSPIHKRSTPEPDVCKEQESSIHSASGEGSIDSARILLESAVVNVVEGVPSVSRNITADFEDAMSAGMSVLSSVVGVQKDSRETTRSCTPGSDVDMEPSTPRSDMSSGQVSRAPTHISEGDYQHESDDDVPGSPTSLTSQVTHSPPPPHFDFDIGDPHRTLVSGISGVRDDQSMLDARSSITHTRRQTIADPMTTSVYSAFSEEPLEEFVERHIDNRNEGQVDPMTSSLYIPSANEESLKITSSENVLESVLNTTVVGELASIDTVGFDRAVEEHRAARGTDLTRSTESIIHESNQTALPGVAEKEGSARSTAPREESQTEQNRSAVTPEPHVSHDGSPSASSQIAQSATSQDPTKDPIESWGKPLGLPSRKDPIESWGKPLGLPSPVPPSVTADESVPSPKGTPQKDRLGNRKPTSDNKKRPESPRRSNKLYKGGPIYIDLTYVPHHGNSYYASLEFFKRVRARYYVFSGIEPSREVYNALLEAKQSWEDKDLEVTIIPTYDTDTLGYWVAENEDALAKYKIDLSPSASRCTINLQDHETSCSAYRLEF